MNMLRVINGVGERAGVQATLEEEGKLLLSGPQLTHRVSLKYLTRPSPGEVSEALLDPASLLILSQPNAAAREAARGGNHLILPDGTLSISLPGLVLVSPGSKEAETPSQTVRLRGAAGRIAESLILGKDQDWTLRALAENANVSLGLVHRVMTRLRDENLVEGERGYRVTSVVSLAKLWASENSTAGARVGGCYIYARTPLEAALKLQEAIPGGCLGGALAANSYTARLSAVPPPYRFWIPEEAPSRERLATIPGLELTEEGANFELFKVRNNDWQVHSNLWEGLSRISRARCYVELYESTGRLHELAEAVLEGL